jgi:capsular exopolysaccharide synthesis family protein
MTDPVHRSNDLRDLVAVLRRRRWSVFLVTALVCATSLFLSLRQTPIYTSSAQVAVNPFDPNQVLNGFNNFAFLGSMQNEVSLAESPSVARIAEGIAETETGSAEETGSLSVDNPTDTSLLVFSYSDPSPDAAQTWANAYAEAYVQDRQRRADEAYTASTAALNRQLDDAQAELAAKQTELLTATGERAAVLQSQVNTINNTIAGLQARLGSIPEPYDTATQVVAEAVLPVTPSSPKPIRDGVLGLILGFGLGIGAGVLRERLDDRTVGKNDMEFTIGAPVLAVIPRVPGWRKRSSEQLVTRDAPRAPASEAYRTVRTNLLFIAQTEGARVIAVTSGNLGEGKTTSAANIAASLAHSGKRVVVISGDLRKPRLHRFFGVENRAGLADLLDGRATILAVAQRCGIETLRVIASGPVPSNPAELLGSDRMRSLLDDLRGATDFVILDTAPILAVSDALPLATMVDGVIVVADAEATTRSALTHVREQLEQVGANIIGGIYNNFDPSKAKGYGAYYGYGSKGYEERPSRRGRDDVADPGTELTTQGVPGTDGPTPEQIWK